MTPFREALLHGDACVNHGSVGVKGGQAATHDAEREVLVLIDAADEDRHAATDSREGDDVAKEQPAPDLGLHVGQRTGFSARGSAHASQPDHSLRPVEC